MPERRQDSNQLSALGKLVIDSTTRKTDAHAPDGYLSLILEVEGDKEAVWELEMLAPRSGHESFLDRDADVQALVQRAAEHFDVSVPPQADGADEANPD